MGSSGPHKSLRSVLSNFSMQKNLLKSLLKHRFLGSICKVSDSAGLSQSKKIVLLTSSLAMLICQFYDHSLRIIVLDKYTATFHSYLGHFQRHQFPQSNKFVKSVQISSLAQKVWSPGMYLINSVLKQITTENITMAILPVKSNTILNLCASVPTVDLQKLHDHYILIN